MHFDLFAIIVNWCSNDTIFGQWEPVLDLFLPYESNHEETGETNPNWVFSQWEKSLGVLSGLHWNYRSMWGEITSSR